MPAPTPSPHRFLPPSAHSTHPAKPKPRPKPQSALRHGFSAQTQTQTPKAAVPSRADQAQTPRVTPAKRFVIAPARETAAGLSVQPGRSGGQGRRDGIWTHTQTPATPLAKPRRKLTRVESIEVGSQESPPGSAHLGLHGERIARLIEEDTRLDEGNSHGHGFGDDDDDDDDNDAEEELLFTPQNPKRRRLTPNPDVDVDVDFVSSSSPIRDSTSHVALQTSAPATSTSSHRFIVPPPRSLAVSTLPKPTTPAPPSHRPHFLLPPQVTSPPAPTQPLPSTFSPQRKGQKYLPGGLATTLQSWIIEAANTGYAAQTRDTVLWGREKEDGMKVRVRVKDIRGGRGGDGGGGSVECAAGGVFFVSGERDMDAGLYNASREFASQKGESQASGDVKVMLSGQGNARTGIVKLGRGNMVGIRAPVWDVVIEGEKWIVGVDWGVLS
ncbi:hypothetical protein BCR34DRAFT_534725 [Clohesyomyces aquaticus]|uniref:Uncharacterized protein n=1 Tax=Clohesyomyces aquaticus TaxID=1231657 RepID=A0A1Y1ZUQ3_9PLEO|nr:hypothetical protein BCR34DRAFT_534725 [Clohesyomyces aquaticus]